jgi:predicted GIY-YIG superfamily endonuclease
MPDNEVVYLIHFDQPYYHARHYLGTTNDLAQRLQQHQWGTRYGGARLMEVITQAGITWRVACTWPGGRALERQLKNWHGGARLCPICKAERFVDQMIPDTVSEEETEDSMSV